MISIYSLVSPSSVICGKLSNIPGLYSSPLLVLLLELVDAAGKCMDTKPESVSISIASKMIL